MEESNPKNYQILTDQDLKKNQYDIETIEWNIRFGAISLRTLVRTQKLTPYICAKYVVFGGLDGPNGYGRYAFGSEDSWISTSDIPRYQKHITMEQMLEAHVIADAEDEIEAQLEKEQKEQNK